MTIPRNGVGSALSCLLADDSQPLLDALAGLLRGEGFDILGVARTGIEALLLLERLTATAIVLDLRLPDLSGLDVARRAAQILQRKTSVVIYTSFADAKVVSEALDAGARAVVLKDAPPANLLTALAEVASGNIYIDPRLPSPRRHR